MIKKKYPLILLFLGLGLVGCKKEETYEPRNLEIESVFDKIKDKNQTDPNQTMEGEEAEVAPNDEDQGQAEEETNPPANEANQEGADLKELEANVNMRQEPSMGDNILLQSTPGMKVKVLETGLGPDQSFTRVEYEGAVYFVNTNMVRQ
ncbi:MAG: hypothetical protein Q4D88_04770 [Anaerococcus sp.]|nr:hypothetical protein [Anaerococcus sp.]